MNRPGPSAPDEAAFQTQAPAPPGATLAMPAEVAIPEHLLDGGEAILLAVKPSLWFILLVSWRWIILAAALCLSAALPGLSEYRWLLVNAALLLTLLRVVWATVQWGSRLYVLTNRRVMRIRGFVTVEVFECPLTRIQNTQLVLSLAERVVRTGTVQIFTAGYGAEQASWRIVARPLEVHEQLRAAIRRAQSRGSSGA